MSKIKNTAKHQTKEFSIAVVGIQSLTDAKSGSGGSPTSSGKGLDFLIKNQG